MSEGPSDHDRDLLSRLNALKQSTIDLDANQCDYPPPFAIRNVLRRHGMSNGRKVELLKTYSLDLWN